MQARGGVVASPSSPLVPFSQQCPPPPQLCSLKSRGWGASFLFAKHACVCVCVSPVILIFFLHACKMHAGIRTPGHATVGGSPISPTSPAHTRMDPRGAIAGCRGAGGCGFLGTIRSGLERALLPPPPPPPPSPGRSARSTSPESTRCPRLAAGHAWVARNLLQSSARLKGSARRRFLESGSLV